MKRTFTLKFQRSDDNWGKSDFAEQLGAAGCGNALIGAGLSGHIEIRFTRDAGSKDAAIKFARAEVMKAIPPVC